MDRKHHTLKDLVLSELARVGGLTVVEGKVLALEVDGLSDQDIADTRSTSHWTASQHVKAVHGKLGCHGRAELFALVLATADRIWRETLGSRPPSGASDPTPSAFRNS